MPTNPEDRTMNWAIKVSKELREEAGEAEQRLKDKCKWEHMTRTGVLIDWGDPREWPPL